MSEEKISLTTAKTADAAPYDIVIGTSIISRLPTLAAFEKHSKVLFIVDDKLKNALSPLLSPLLTGNTSAIYFPCGEKNKDFLNLQKLLGEFHQAGLDRKSLCINIGGGMLGDFAGFAASIYMRGIDFVQVPTTLLAQVDASVGGKVAINFAGVKNLIGSFRQPKLVVIDTSLLTTLPERELYSGFAEIIKHAFIYDSNFIDTLESAAVNRHDQPFLASVIKRSCQIKAEVVAQDPLESGLRKILNFGHTIGHAIEAAAAEDGEPMLHGECVALGMIAEAAIAQELKYLNAADTERIERLLERYHLPIRAPQKFSVDRLLEFMRHDKKNSGGKISCALLTTLGMCAPAVEVREEQIRASLSIVGL